jgi:hypothetical protein
MPTYASFEALGQADGMENVLLGDYAT